eukprot:m.231608 g.231608  ORF g.231608 m.231608 type:complete len:551 (-) comp12239_c0_seq1:53-1705(-)
MKKLFQAPDRPSAAVQRAAAAHGLSIFYVKYLGAIEVSEPKGAHVAETAMKQVIAQCEAYKKSGWQAPKAELSITSLGLKVTDRANGKVFIDLPLRQVSYCQDERATNRYFVFIAREQPDQPMKCFVYKSDYQAAEIMTALGSAFKKAASEEPKSSAGASSNKAAAVAWAGARETQPPAQQSRSKDSEIETLRRQLQEKEAEAARLRAALNGGGAPAAAASRAPVRVTSPRGPPISADDDAAGYFTLDEATSPKPRGGFDSDFGADSFGAPAAPAVAAVAAPAPAVRQGQRNPNNPYARARGAPPPTQLAATSQISVPTTAGRKGPPSPKPPRADFATSAAPSASAWAAAPSAAPTAPAAASFPAGLTPVGPIGSALEDFGGAATVDDAVNHAEPLDDLNDIDDLVSQVATQATVSSGGAIELPESGQGAGSESDDDTAAAGISPGEWQGSEHVPLVPLCNHVWGLATPDDEGLVDGGQIRPLMMMSQLPNETLSEIWGLVDTEQRGAVDFRQFGYLLGLMSLAQRGEPLDTSLIGPDTPSPHLEGLQPM